MAYNYSALNANINVILDSINTYHDSYANATANNTAATTIENAKNAVAKTVSSLNDQLSSNSAQIGNLLSQVGVLTDQVALVNSQFSYLVNRTNGTETINHAQLANASAYIDLLNGQLLNLNSQFMNVSANLVVFSSGVKNNITNLQLGLNQTNVEVDSISDQTFYLTNVVNSLSYSINDVFSFTYDKLISVENTVVNTFSGMISMFDNLFNQLTGN